MIRYVESSAALAWLLSEPPSGEVRAQLAGAERLVASELTLLECERTLLRAVTGGRVAEAAAASLRATLARAAATWSLLVIDREVLARAARPFPHEPVRMLDALHLASALRARAFLPELELLSLDERVRSNARALGFVVAP